MNAAVVSDPANNPIPVIYPSMVSICILEKRRESPQRRGLAKNDVSRHGSNIAGKPSLGFEARAKRRAREIFSQPRNNAAADITAGSGTECHDQVCSGGPENGTEHLERCLALDIGVRQRRGGDLVW